jgi:hypothetical protein
MFDYWRFGGEFLFTYLVILVVSSSMASSWAAQRTSVDVVILAASPFLHSFNGRGMIFNQE